MALGFFGLRNLVFGQSGGNPSSGNPYGDLLPDPAGILALPRNFFYRVISRTGERMSDGFAVPSSHDGMAAFPGPDGKTILIRNHEASNGAITAGPFAGGGRRFQDLDRQLIYDAGSGVSPALGGTTTLVYDTRTGTLDTHFLSLTGTIRNCAGGATPWGTWVTCEENVQRATGNFEKNHGFNFEVQAAAEGLAVPIPIKGMGRFNHEAIAVDPRSWIVYQTEDRDNSLIYRYIPAQRGDLARGGKLQAMVVTDKPWLDTRNLSLTHLPVGEVVAVTWVDVEDVESASDDLRLQGFSKGAAMFARGEGMWASPEAIFFVCTGGGRAGKGQVFRYVPSAYEGRREESKFPGRLELFIEPNDASLVDNPDNVTVAPWGDLILCEDGPNGNFVLGVTPEGEVYKLARNVLNTSEFCGATFSPDGTTLFVNIQSPGLTLAIIGPWQAEITIPPELPPLLNGLRHS